MICMETKDYSLRVCLWNNGMVIIHVHMYCAGSLRVDQTIYLLIQVNQHVCLVYPTNTKTASFDWIAEYKHHFLNYSVI